MKKIVILGSSGSGKSYLSKKLSKELNIEVYHLDNLMRKFDWSPFSHNEKYHIQKLILENDTWIIEGNYTNILDERLDEADTIIFLNINKLKCIYNVIKRTITYRNKDRLDKPAKAIDKISLHLLKWTWNFDKNEKTIIIKKIQNYSKTKRIIILNNFKTTNNFFDGIVK
ncbi:AAA family ATPase [Mammaliicoccus sciuri]|uniref:AAA family ATPase n=1 Tax=Mammaliicoccus sciuri TaxID=1296 RepID=UPI003F56F3A7